MSYVPIIQHQLLAQWTGQHVAVYTTGGMVVIGVLNSIAIKKRASISEPEELAGVLIVSARDTDTASSYITAGAIATIVRDPNLANRIPAPAPEPDPEPTREELIHRLGRYL